jgi:hypothetical protein
MAAHPVILSEAKNPGVVCPTHFPPFCYLTPCVPLSLRSRVKERGKKKKEGLPPLLNT